MNRSVTVAIIVSVVGFAFVVSLAFLTYKLKPREVEVDPDSPLDGHSNPSNPPFSPPSTRRYVIRGGRVVPASQKGTSSIRSGFSWTHHRYGLRSGQPSHADLRQTEEEARPRPPRKDVEKGIVDAVVESTLFMPQRASIAAPPTLDHPRPLSIVPEMSQTSLRRSLQTRGLSRDVRQLLKEVRTETPATYHIQRTHSTPVSGTAPHCQIYELPATPVPPHSPTLNIGATNGQQTASTSNSAIESSTPTSTRLPVALMSPLDATTPISPVSPTTPLTRYHLTGTSSPSTSTPGRPSMDDATRSLLRSKYNHDGPST